MTMNTQTTMSYGHWGIDVVTKWDGKITAIKTFHYPVGTRGPVDSPKTEAEAIAYCRELGGVVKGPFFKR